MSSNSKENSHHMCCASMKKKWLASNGQEGEDNVCFDSFSPHYDFILNILHSIPKLTAR